MGNISQLLPFTQNKGLNLVFRQVMPALARTAMMLAAISAVTMTATIDSYGQIYTYTDASSGAPATVDPNATATNLTRGAGLVAAAGCAEGFGAESWPNPTYAGASSIAGSNASGDYVEFILKPNPGYRLHVTGFSAATRRTGAAGNARGPRQIAYAYSTDGINYISYTGPFTPQQSNTCTQPGTVHTWTGFPVTGLQDSIIFRIYGYDAGSNGTGDLFLKSITVEGSVCPGLELEIDGPDTLQCGATAEVTVQANAGFCGLSSLDFSVNWDTAQFEYVSYTAGIIDGEAPAVGEANVALGALTFAWADGVLPCGADLSDSTVLLTISLRAKGCPADLAEVSLGDDPLLIEAADCSFLEPVSINVLNNAFIQVLDTVPPALTCPDDLTLYCDPQEAGNYAAQIAGWLSSAVAVDACSGAIPVDNLYEDGTLPDLCSSLEVAFLALDPCDNEASCTAYIWLQDTLKPEIACPDTLNALCDDAERAPYASLDDFIAAGGSASDACLLLPATFVLADQSNNEEICPQIVTRIYEISDSCGNTATCEQIVVVNDDELPELTCPDTLWTACDVSALPPYADLAAFEIAGGTAADSCGIDEVSLQMVLEATDTLRCPETILRTYQIADICGNTASCIQVLIIHDTIAPALTCPPGLTTACDDGDLPPYAYYADFIEAGADPSDNCAIDTSAFELVSVSSDGNTCPEIVTRVYQVADSCGNTATCEQLITVDDEELPVLSCPAPLTAICEPGEQVPYENLAAFINAGGSLSENCSADTASFDMIDEIPGSQTCPNLVQRIYFIEDLCGNSDTCVQWITVDDNVFPEINCPDTMRVNCNADTSAAVTGTATATDNCGNVTISRADVILSGDCPQEWTIERSWTAVDDCGNATTCVQIIYVQDTIAPVITCPVNAEVECDDDQTPANTGSATATDNCDLAPVITYADSMPQGQCPAAFIRVWTAADACGNTSTCAQTIRVDDTTQPLITCPDTARVSCELAANTALTGEPVVEDNCDSDILVTFDTDTLPGGCPQELLLKRTWLASDDCLNAAACIQYIYVVDTTAPVITCPQNTSVECSDDQSPDALGIPAIQDNCDPAPLKDYDDNFAPSQLCAQEGILTRLWTVTDACGNSTTCEQIISVTDDTPPAIVCPDPLTVSCDGDTSPASTGIPEPEDLCDTDVALAPSDQIIPGNCPYSYQIIRTWITSDDCGNADACTQTITVTDTTAPQIVCPADTVVDCTASVNPAALGTATATDNCAAAVTNISFADSVLAGNCAAERLIRRIWAATDSCFNTATCEQRIAVQDTTKPVIICPADVTVNCEASLDPGVNADLGVASATDNCDVELNYTFDHLDTIAGSCPQAYVLVRRWAAIDDCQNVSTCLQNITVQDTTAPNIACPADVTVNCEESLDPGQNANLGVASAQDNCVAAAAISYSDAVAPGACVLESTVTRTWLAADSCGNSATCVQIIEVQDTTAPQIVCPANRTVECDDNLDPQINTALGSASATDNCDNAPAISFSDVEVQGQCALESIVTRTWLAADSCGNSVSCVQIITVRDTTAPQIVCPANTTVSCEDASPMVAGSATATDNCDDAPLITYNDAVTPGNCPDARTIARTWLAADSCGNSATCVQTIAVQDNTAPMISCPPDATVDCDASTAPASTGVATATDNCDSAPALDFIDTRLEGSCPQADTIRRRWIAVDNCANAAVCLQLILLQDTVAPQLNCPQNVTVNCEFSLVPGANAPTGIATAVDNCDLLTIPVHSDVITPGDCPQERLVTRTWTAIDSCGNSATCIQLITVQDTTKPVIVCPPGVSVECDQSIDPLINPLVGEPDASDNCDTALTVTKVDVSEPGQCPQERIVTRTWVALDACGNLQACLQTITVTDTTAPQIVCPADTVVDCTASVNPAALGTATATDNCAAAVTNISFADSVLAGNCAAERLIRRIWAATDSCFNTATCEQRIAVQDTTKPVIICPVDVTVNCEASLDPGVNADLGVASATDNCDVELNYTFDHLDTIAGNCPQAYMLVRRWAAADDCQNVSSCLQNITVQDTTAPNIACPADVTVNCEASLDPGQNADLGVATAQDNCVAAAAISYSDAVAPGACALESTVTRTWLAADSCGNTATCVQIIEVQDTTAPQIVCPPNRTVECDDNLDPQINTALGSATATDNCDDAPAISFSDTQVQGQCALESIVTRTWLAADSCGNSVSCVQIITVRDTTAPVVLCPANTTVECDDVSPMAAGTATATDNCDDAPQITFTDSDTQGACPQERIISRTWLAVDSCGNSATCVQTIAVQDNTAPQIFCPADITVNCESSLDTMITGAATAIDNCDPGPAITFSDDSAPGSCPQERLVTRTWFAVDDCGNVQACDQLITLRDTTAPAIVCAPDLTVNCEVNLTPGPTAPTGASTATDNCDPAPALSHSDAEAPVPDCPQAKTVTRTWTATDGCGNSVTCVQIIFVQDTTSPVLTCPGNVTIACEQSIDPNINPAVGEATVTDNCDPDPVLTYFDVKVAGQCVLDTIVTRTWLSSDACDNATLCKQIIAWVDTAGPTLVCPADTVVNCNTDLSPASLGTATAEDNCGATPAVQFSDNATPGACPQERTITRTWTANDECGNPGSCIQTITVQDTTAPQIVCPLDVTVNCEASLDPEVNADLGVASATDNCDVELNYTFDHLDTIAGSCPQAYVLVRRWAAVDDCQNVSSCLQNITVQDTTAPNIACPADVTVNCEASLDPGQNADLGVATAQDNCVAAAAISYSDAVAPGACALESTVTRTWLAADSCGNSATCVQIIEVQDTTAPQIVCPANRTVECDDNLDPQINTALGSATATDNCDDAPFIGYTDNDVTGQCALETIITRSWYAADSCGNSAFCTQIITVRDTTAPVIVCPANTTVNCEDVSPMAAGLATATDNCDDAPQITFTDSDTQGACPQERTITRTWMAADSCGNSATCVQTIAVQDTTAPQIFCPADITVNCESSLDTAITGVATAIDNCDPSPAITFVDLAAPGACPQERAVTRTWFAVDDCANARACDQLITLQDTTAPTIVCAPDLTVNCEVNLTPGPTAPTGASTATDNCDPAPVLSHSDAETPVPDCPQAKTVTRTWTALDACGNSATCVQIIFVQDTTRPAIICPANVTIACEESIDPNVNPNVGLPNITDNCDPNPVRTYLDVKTPGQCLLDTIVTRTWLTSDACDNAALCQQIISWLDTAGPTLVCPADTVVNCNTDLSPASLGTATAEDNCGTASAVQFSDSATPGTCPQERTITRTWTSNDECGNTGSCIQTITVQDTVPPQITCPAGITVDCEDGIDPQVTGSATATDDCALAVTNFDYADAVTPGGCPQESLIGRTWMAIDSCGNMATCLQTITVQDTTAPNIACPADVTVNCEESLDPAQNANLGSASAQDNCAAAAISYSDAVAPGACALESTLTRTWLAADSCGNSATCVQIIEVQDTTAPQIVCPPNRTVECDDNLDPQINTALGSATATDNCDSAPLISYADTEITGQCPQENIISRRWLSVDSCGNADSCIQLIFLRDTTPPALQCPPNATVECDDVSPAAAGSPVVTDNCDPEPITGYSDNATPGNCPDERTIIRTWTAADHCGNTTASCTQTITVKDDTPPVISCPADVTVNCEDATDPLATGEATATDNCDSQVAVTFLDENIATDNCPQDTILRRWFAVDNCNNAAACTQTIVVQDTTAPVLVCPQDVTVSCESSLEPGPNAPTGIATASDNCDQQPVVTYQDAETAGACPQERIITRTWTAEDACGNSSTCVQLIRVIDETDPVITCPPAVTVECDASLDPDENPALGVATATDNCDPELSITYINQDTVPGQCLPAEMIIFRAWVASDDCNNAVACSQTIHVEDNTGPLVTCPPGITIECSGDTDPQTLGFATAEDNCGTVSTPTYNDEVAEGDCPFERTITRTWSSVDNCNNTGTCVQIIAVADTLAPSIVCPPDITVNCDAELDPQINPGLGLASTTDDCDLSPELSYSDTTFTGQCPTPAIVQRTWMSVDTCGNTATCLQLIALTDTVPPALSCPAADLTLECGNPDNPTLIANWLASASVQDNCGQATVSHNYDAGNFSDGCGATGAQTVTFSASDECQTTATATCTRTIEILDTTPPTINGDCNLLASYGNGLNAASYVVATSGGAACPGAATLNLAINQVISDTTTITVGGVAVPGILGCLADNCSAPENLTARVVDIIAEGDNCIKTFEIRMVVVDECDNESVDTLSYFIEVIDDTPPTISCPPADLTLECGNPDNASAIAAWLNSAAATDNCGNATALNDFNADNFSDGCGATGTQTVTFTAADACQNSGTSTCSKTVTILDTTPPTVTCPPADLTLECGDPDNATLIAGWLASASAEDNCGTATVSHDYDAGNFSDGCGLTGAQTVSFQGIDECQNVSASTCSRTITISDNTPPALTCPAGVTINCTESTDPDNNQALGSATATDACGTQPVAITYSDTTASGDCPELRRITRTWRGEDACGNATTCVQIISVIDTVPPAFTAPADITLYLDADCSVSLDGAGDVTDESDNCSGNLDATYTDAVDEGPGDSEYVVARTWTLADDCGNITTHTQFITVRDTLAPSIDCPADLSVAPNDAECAYTVDDASLDPQTDDNCGIKAIGYELSGITEGSGTGSLEGVSFNEGETLVTWTVTDLNGNTATCTFTVTVTSCLQISGTLIWEGDDTDLTGVKDGTVDLTGDATDTDGPTPASGAYTLIAGSGSNFVITPSKPAPPADPMNGVSTLDALLVQQYIVGMHTFPDAYKMIAADVNFSNGITTLDASIIRQAILGGPAALAWFQNRPWRFVPTPANTPYSTGYLPPADPFSAPIPSTRVLSGVVADAVGEDFYGIKTGDVNATGNPLLHPVNEQPLLFKIQDQRLEAGKELLVVFRASQFDNLAAYQMALRFDTAQLQLLGVEPLSDVLKLSANGNFGLHNAAAGEIRHVWIDPYGKTLADGEQAFALRFSALQSGAWLHDVLGLKPKTLAPEAYTPEHATGELKLIFTEPEVTTGVSDADPEAPGALLFQNTPNPFDHHTVIGFFLPEGCDAQLRVIDAAGRELWRVNKTYPAGYHAETVLLRDLGTGGLLWYELITPRGKQARKMVAAGP